MLFTDLPEDYQDIFNEKTLQERLRLLLEYEPEAEEPRQKRYRRYDDNEEVIGANDRLFALLLVEAKCRLAFKRLLNNWLKRRSDKIPLNTDDPITLCPYNEPLIVYDITNRSRHCFESKSLMTNIYHQLRYSFGGFPKPLNPMNPITNIPFNTGQLLHIFDSAIRLGYWSVEFMAFRAAAFNINLYTYVQERPLRFAAIKEFIYGGNNKNIMIEEMLNFIIGTANKRGTYPTGAEIRRLSFGLKNDQHPYVVQWMRIFEEYLKYDLKSTPTVRYCPEQIKKSRAISSELNILIAALNRFLDELKAPYNEFIAQQQLHVNNELEENDIDDEDDIDDEGNEMGTVIYTAGMNVEDTFRMLLDHIRDYNNAQQR